MKQFIITEEERKRILGIHEQRTSRHYLMEEPMEPEMDEEIIEQYDNSLYSDIMELIHDSNSSHEETIDVLNSIVDEMSSSKRMRRNVERRFRDEMNEEGEPYAPGMKPTSTGPQGKSPGLNAPKIKEFKGIQDPEWRAICSDLQKLGFRQAELKVMGTDEDGYDDGTLEIWVRNNTSVGYHTSSDRKNFVTVKGYTRWDQMPKDYKTNRCYAGIPRKHHRLYYDDDTREGEKFNHGYVEGGILKSCKKEILDFVTKIMNNKF